MIPNCVIVVIMVVSLMLNCVIVVNMMLNCVKVVILIVNMRMIQIKSLNCDINSKHCPIVMESVVTNDMKNHVLQVVVWSP